MGWLPMVYFTVGLVIGILLQFTPIIQRSHIPAWSKAPVNPESAPSPAVPQLVPNSLSPNTASEHEALLSRIYPLHDIAMSYQSVPFEKYQVILITGPQRSGTTWVACALANQLEYVLYDERHPIFGGNDTLRAVSRAFAYVRQQKQRTVIQSPMATLVLDKLQIFPGLVIVFLGRDCLEVFRSQNKVEVRRGGWTCAAGRTKELRKYQNRPELRSYFDSRDMICKVKQDVWRSFQLPHLLKREAEQRVGADPDAQPRFNVTATVDFRSFRHHPLWMRAEKRKGLSIKATNCEVAAATPARNRWSNSQWMAKGDAARVALGEIWDTSASDMIIER